MIKHEGGSFEAPRVQPSYWVTLFIFCCLPLVCRFGFPSVWPFTHQTLWLNIFNRNGSAVASPTTTSNPRGSNEMHGPSLDINGSYKSPVCLSCAELQLLPSIGVRRATFKLSRPVILINSVYRVPRRGHCNFGSVFLVQRPFSSFSLKVIQSVPAERWQNIFYGVLNWPACAQECNAITLSCHSRRSKVLNISKASAQKRRWYSMLLFLSKWLKWKKNHSK